MTFQVDTTSVQNASGFDAVTNMASVGVSWSHTLNALANKIVIAIGMGASVAEVNRTVISVTVGGQAASFIGKQDNGNFCRAEIWQLNAPPTGTQTIVVKGGVDGGGTPVRGGAGAVSFIDAAASIRDQGGGTGTANSQSVTLAGTVSGDIVVDSYIDDIGPNGSSSSAGGGTNLYDIEDIGSDIDVGSAYRTAVGSNTVAQWNKSVSGDSGSIYAVAVQPLALADYPRRPRQFNRRAGARFM